MKRAFTIVEALVVVAIIGILLALIISIVFGTSGDYYDKTGQGVYRCVKTYTVNDGGHSTSKRVDLRPMEGGPVETFLCDDDWWADVYNSASLYAQFEPNKLYEIEFIGYRREGAYALFPLITAVSELQEEFENPLAEVQSDDAFH